MSTWNELGVHVGVALGVPVAVAVGVAEGITVGVGVDDGEAVGVAVGVDDPVAVAVAVGVGVGVPQMPKISIEAVGVVGAYPPASQMRSVPLVSVGKLRRAVTNGVPVDQVPATGS
jgi:hypothetical protein